MRVLVQRVTSASVSVGGAVVGAIRPEHQGLLALVEPPKSGPKPARWSGYMDKLPNDPWGREFLYLAPGKHGDVDVFSRGPNGRSGDDDDIGSWTL